MIDFAYARNCRQQAILRYFGEADPKYYLNYSDLPGTNIPVQYNTKNFGANGSLGVLLLHRHNADGQRSDVVTFTQQ
jgi:superfamily II DNA helicase RecQ